MAGGRPTKLTKKIKPIIELCARRGFTDKEIAQVVGITDRTLDNWKKKHAEFFRALKDWKQTADEKVERALFERATGYKCPDTKAQWVSDESGGRFEYAEMEKHYPPDTPAATLWLKNRKPDEWRDTQHVQVDGLNGIADRIRAGRNEGSG